MKNLLHTAAVGLFLVATGLAGSGDVPFAARALELLDSVHATYDATEAQRAAAEAILKSVDPRARLLVGDEGLAHPGSDWVPCSVLWSNSLGYIRIAGIGGTAGRLVGEQVAAWNTNGLDGVILDLRRAEGNNEDALARLAGLCVPDGSNVLAIVRCRADGTNLTSVVARGDGPADCPVILLSDRETAGAAEALVAVLKGVPGVLVVGEETSGDGRLREYLSDSDTFMAYVATARFARRDGTLLVGNGTPPDIEVARVAVQEPVQLAIEEIEAAFVSTNGTADFLTALSGDAALSRSIDILLGLRAISERAAVGEIPEVEVPPLLAKPVPGEK